MKESSTIQRTLFLKACMEKDISKNTIFAMSTIIKHTREREGHPMAEKKAMELREIIERCKTEDEILSAIVTMEKATAKATTDDAQE